MTSNKEEAGSYFEDMPPPRPATDAERTAWDAEAAAGEAVAEVAPLDKSLPFSDVYNAMLLVREHGQDLRYCHPWNKWYVWNGRYWEADAVGTVMAWAKATIRGLQAWTSRQQAEFHAWLKLHPLEKDVAPRQAQFTALLKHVDLW